MTPSVTVFPDGARWRYTVTPEGKAAITSEQTYAARHHAVRAGQRALWRFAGLTGSRKIILAPRGQPRPR